MEIFIVAILVNRTTFGTAGRDFVNAKDVPAPNRYRPV
jgi:hypothetical protein